MWPRLSRPASFMLNHMTQKYKGHRLDHWRINLSIEMMKWRELIDWIDELIDYGLSLKISR